MTAAEITPWLNRGAIGMDRRNGASTMCFRILSRCPALCATAALLWISIFSSVATAADGAAAASAQGSAPFDKASFALKGVELRGSNLSADELEKIVSHSVTMEEAAPILSKLTAASIAIAELTFASPNRALTIYDIKATDVKDGKASRLSFGSVAARSEIEGAESMVLRIGAIEIESGNIGGLLTDLTRGDPTIRHAKASRVVLSDLDLTLPDKSVPANERVGNPYRIRLATFETQSSYDGTTLKNATLLIKALKIEAPRTSKFSESMLFYGYDKFEMDAKFIGRYQPESRTYVLDDFTISALNAGSINLEGRFENIDRSAFDGDKDHRAKALANADVSHLAIRVTNTGYFEKALARAAARQGKTQPQILAQLNVDAARLLLDKPAQNPSAKSLYDSITAFAANPRSLTIAANVKGKSVKLSNLKEFQTLDEFLARVDVTAMSGQ
jgi:hypothetical protein